MRLLSFLENVNNTILKFLHRNQDQFHAAFSTAALDVHFLYQFQSQLSGTQLFETILRFFTAMGRWKIFFRKLHPYLHHLCFSNMKLLRAQDVFVELDQCVQRVALCLTISFILHVPSISRYSQILHVTLRFFLTYWALLLHHRRSTMYFPPKILLESERCHPIR